MKYVLYGVGGIVAAFALLVLAVGSSEGFAPGGNVPPGFATNQGGTTRVSGGRRYIYGRAV